MVIDHHVHLGEDPNKTKFSLTLAELIEKMDRFGIDKSVVFSCPNVMPKEKNPYAEENDRIYKAFLEVPDRIIPFMFVHPFRDGIDYLKENHGKFSGFKIYSCANEMEYSYADLVNSPQMRFLASTGKPMLFHTAKQGGGRITDAIGFIKSVSNPLAFAHSGRFFGEDLREASRYSHVFVDVAPLATNLYKPEIFFASGEDLPAGVNLNPSSVISHLNNLFEGRVLWGSDTPWSDQILTNGYSAEIDVLAEMKRQGISNSGFLK